MPLTISDISVAELLKKKTRESHMEAEQLLIPKLSSITSLGDYAALLKMFYGFYKPLEEKIAQYLQPQHIEDIDGRRKASSILSDLKSLAMASENIELCTSIPAINNIQQAYGALYVLEGSSLGGRVICKMLLKNEYIKLNESSLSFFNGYGEETGKKWIYFLSRLNEQQQGQDQVVNTANETFLQLQSWIFNTLYGESKN